MKRKKIVGTIDTDLVNVTISRYTQAYMLLRDVELKLKPILARYNLDFIYREDIFESVWNSRRNELMRFCVLSKDQKQSGFLIIESSGNVILELEKSD